MKMVLQKLQIQHSILINAQNVVDKVTVILLLHLRPTISGKPVPEREETADPNSYYNIFWTVSVLLFDLVTDSYFV